MQTMKINAIAVPKWPPIRRSGEQQHDDQADQHRGENRQPDRPVDQDDAPVEHPHLVEQPVVLAAAAGEQPRFDVAGAVDDPRQPAGADVEERADAGEQEHRRKHRLDDRGDFA